LFPYAMEFRATTRLAYGCLVSDPNLRPGAYGQCANDSVVAIPPSRGSRRSGSSICAQHLCQSHDSEDGVRSDGPPPLLEEAQVAGLVTSFTINEVNQLPRPPISQTSDDNWPAEIQQSWLWFIIGVSQTWLKLIEAVSANALHQGHANLPPLT
jgi:hypothetical protein